MEQFELLKPPLQKRLGEGLPSRKTSRLPVCGNGAGRGLQCGLSGNPVPDIVPERF